MHTSLPGLVVTLSQADACHCLASSTGCYLRSSLVLLAYSPSPEGGGSNSAEGPCGWGLPPKGFQLPFCNSGEEETPRPHGRQKTLAKPRPFSDLYHLLQSRRSSSHVREGGKDVGISWCEVPAAMCLPREGCCRICPSAFPPWGPQIPHFFPCPLREEPHDPKVAFAAL